MSIRFHGVAVVALCIVYGVAHGADKNNHANDINAMFGIPQDAHTGTASAQGSVLRHETFAQANAEQQRFLIALTRTGSMVPGTCVLTQYSSAAPTISSNTTLSSPLLSDENKNAPSKK